GCFVIDAAPTTYRRRAARSGTAVAVGDVGEAARAVDRGPARPAVGRRGRVRRVAGAAAVRAGFLRTRCAALGRGSRRWPARRARPSVVWRLWRSLGWGR